MPDGTSPALPKAGPNGKVEVMSAYVDQDQVVKFYYGNAIEDLKDFLPPDEAPFVKTHATSSTQTHVASSNVMQSLDSSLSSLESLMGELKGAQRELSYLVNDLSRMVKKVR